MMKAKMLKLKALTPEQRLMAAHMHLISGIDQHAISGALGVNPGRVAEAIIAIRMAMEDPKGVAMVVRGAQSSGLL